MDNQDRLDMNYKSARRAIPAAYFEGDPAWHIDQLDEDDVVWDIDPFGGFLFKELKERHDHSRTH